MTLARLIASGCGTGWFPVAPGTAASAVAVVLALPLMWLSPYALPVAVLVTSIAGLWAIGAAGIEDDPGWVVIDEFAGQFLALIGLAHASVIGLLAGFLIFRLLDVTKPGAIGWADRQDGAVGIMADDLLAGGIAAGIIWAVRSSWPWMLG